MLKCRISSILNLTLFLFLTYMTSAMAQEVTLDLDTASGSPGEKVSVQLSLDGEGLPVSGFAIDIGFDAEILSNVSGEINPAIGPGSVIDRQLISNKISPDTLRIGIIPASFSQTSLQKVIPDGFVATITFDINPDASYGLTTLTNVPSSSNSVGEGLFTGGQAAAINIISSGISIPLKPGWNLISFPVNKCFYDGTQPDDQPDCVDKISINELGFSSLSDWFDFALTPNDAWQMVIGMDGAMDSSLPSDYHSLKYMSPCSGYWVKIKEGVSDAILSLNGQLFDPECPISLKNGWVLVGCPLNVGYYDTEPEPSGKHVPEGTIWEKVNSPVAEYVFGSIADKYDLIIGEEGAYNPALPPAFNSLHFVAPGFGYWVKMNSTADLVYSILELEASTLAAPRRDFRNLR